MMASSDPAAALGASPRAAGSAPLADVIVLDLSLLFPGPFATQMLGDLGADVISVEPPDGDFTRRLPNGSFAVTNRNKRSVVLDLKTDSGLRACHQLAAKADVFVEGFRPGVVDRLGVGYDAIAEHNPAIIYCSISGYGQTGPRRSAPGHDLTYLATSGALSFPGHWSEPPRRQGLPVADAAASSFAAIAILAALHQRERTGLGTHIDVGIADAAMALAALRGGPRLDPPPGDRSHLFPQSDLFTTADGKMLAISPVEEHFWQRLRRCLAPYDARLLDERFDDDAVRRANGDELSARLTAIIALEPAAHWERVFADADVPVDRVLPLGEAVATAQASARGLLTDIDGERHMQFPALCNGRPMGISRRVAAPLGADTVEVLREFGVGEGDIAAVTSPRIDAGLPTTKERG